MNEVINMDGFLFAKNKTRYRILAAATQLFIKKGYHGTSVIDIAMMCGIKKATVYSHYATKQDIALEAMRSLYNYCKNHLFSWHTQKDCDEQGAIEGFLLQLQKFLKEDSCMLLPLALYSEFDHKDERLGKIITEYFSLWKNGFKVLFSTSSHLKECQRILALIYGAVILGSVCDDESYFRLVNKEINAIEGK